MKRVSLALLLILALDARVALGGEPPKKAPPSLSDTLTGEAKEAYEEARRLFKSGDYAASLAALVRAQKLSPDPRIFWNMAACEKKLGHYAKSISYVEKYLAAGGGVLSDAERREGEEFVVAMRTLVGTVTVTSAAKDDSTHAEVSGVQVFVDDELVGATPFAKPLVVDAGERRVRFSRAGYKTVSRAESVPAGGTAAWVLEMEPDTHDARLVVNAGSGESIWVDGKLVGHGQWGGRVPSGSHAVSVTGEGKKSREQAIVLRDNDAATLDLQLQSSSGGSTWLWIGGGVLLAAGAAVGGYFLLKPSSSPTEQPKGTLGTFSFP